VNDVGALAGRAVVGGTFVVAFSLIAAVVTPKAFSGLFAAAPSVALASLSITIVSKGVRSAHADAAGMVPGAIGMVGCCILAVVAIPRLRTLRGSAAAWAAWGAVAMGVYWAVFVGAR